MGQQERQEKLQQLRNELSKAESAVASGTRPESPGKIKELRRTIARIHTIENEKKKKEDEAKK